MRRAPAPLACLLFAGALGCGDDGAPAADAGGGGDAGVPAGERPGKRSDVAGVADPASGTLALFGGDDGPIVDQIPSPSYLGDTWLFDPSAGWEEVTGSPAPSARGRHAVALDPDGGRMLLFGGRYRADGASGDYTLYDDLWAFDFASRAWTELDPGGGGPAPRYFSAAAYDPAAGVFYVYGGGTDPDPLTLSPAMDVWAFDGEGWSQVTTTGEAPSQRLFVAYTYDAQRNDLVVFGGQVGDFVSPGLNDLSALDLDTMTWSQLHDGQGTAPSGRFSAMMAYDASADRYLVAGGHADPGVVNDLWSFDPGQGAWTLLHAGDSFTGADLGCLGNSREIPEDYVDQDLSAPERRASGVLAPLGSSVWLFGGESDCSDHLDDTWRFDLAAGSWSEEIEARSGESCLRRNDDCPCLCL